MGARVPPSSSVGDVKHRSTCATVEDSTAGLGQTIHTGCPLVGGLSFHGTTGCEHEFTGTQAAKRIQVQGIPLSGQTDQHWCVSLFAAASGTHIHDAPIYKPTRKKQKQAQRLRTITLNPKCKRTPCYGTTWATRASSIEHCYILQSRRVHTASCGVSHVVRGVNRRGTIKQSSRVSCLGFHVGGASAQIS